MRERLHCKDRHKLFVEQPDKIEDELPASG
jgi:hypothetical protein